MNEILMILLSAIVGLFLGLFFFGGLLLTVKKGLTSKQPALIFIVSFFLRTLVSIGGFMLMSQGRWQRLVSCLIGFVLVRMVLISMEKTRNKKMESIGKEV